MIVGAVLNRSRVKQMAHLVVDMLNDFPHSSRISERRRALFPNDSDNESELGHMSPLRSESTLSPPDSPLNYVNQRETMDIPHQFDKSSINDYDILGSVNNLSNCLQNNTTELHQSQAVVGEPGFKFQEENSNSLITTNEEIILPDTPLKLSPIKNHQTPQDSVNVTIKVPKLLRKSVDATLNLQENGKRKLLSPESSPSNKYSRLDSITKSSKVRTSLFPERELEFSVSPKSFYPKVEDSKVKKVSTNLKGDSNKSSPRSLPTFICNRRKKNYFGQINAGVRHKIRKPRQKKPSKSQLLKAALNILEMSSLNDYLQEVTNIQSSKSTTPLKLIQQIKEEKKINQNNLQEKIYNGHEQKIPSHEKRKRETSPPSDTNRKFFKSSRSKAVVVINNNIKLNYDQGKMSLSKKIGNRQNNFEIINYDLTDLISNENDEMLSAEKINGILHSLREDKENISKIEKTNKRSRQDFMEIEKSQIVLKADTSVLASVDSIQLHYSPKHNNCENSTVYFEENCGKSNLMEPSNHSPKIIANANEDLFLSPTSQMCDMASGLALNSPKKAIKNITSTLENLENHSVTSSNYNYRPARSIMEQKKLFPVFYGKSCSNDQKTKPSAQNRTQSKSTWKKLPKNQMLLDAGQKKFGATECPECKLIYHMGDPSEEILHLNYHNSGNIFRFNGWKNERVVEHLTDARIIKVMPQDSKIWWRKIKDLLEVVNRDLGIYEMLLNLENVQVYLFIKNKTIQGCVVAEPKSKAYRIMTGSDEGVDTCSEESFPIKCGVSRIWVSKNNRRQGVGSAMMNCLKKTFYNNYILCNNEIAISGPTVEGKIFAEKYFNTKNFLVYTD